MKQTKFHSYAFFKHRGEVSPKELRFNLVLLKFEHRCGRNKYKSEGNYNTDCLIDHNICGGNAGLIIRFFLNSKNKKGESSIRSCDEIYSSVYGKNKPSSQIKHLGLRSSTHVFDLTQIESTTTEGFAQIESTTTEGFAQIESTTTEGFAQIENIPTEEDSTPSYKHLWVVCEECYTLNYKRFLKERLYLCEGCESHLKMNSSERLELLIDPTTWDPMNEKMASIDPIKWDSEEPFLEWDSEEAFIEPDYPDYEEDLPQSDSEEDSAKAFIEPDSELDSESDLPERDSEEDLFESDSDSDSEGDLLERDSAEDLPERDSEEDLFESDSPSESEGDLLERDSEEDLPERDSDSDSDSDSESDFEHAFFEWFYKLPFIRSSDPYDSDYDSEEDLPQSDSAKAFSERDSEEDPVESDSAENRVELDSEEDLLELDSEDDPLELDSEEDLLELDSEEDLLELDSEEDLLELDSEDDPYIYRISSYQKKTGLTEAIQTGIGQLNGIPVAMGVMEFEFMGGSMGSVVGEKITRLIEYATNQSLPLIIVCASGGARMQEGSLSLMQMAKISSALYQFQTNQKLFYVSILTSPTTGGVTASFGMLGDLIVAEPNAYIAFAGKRVIEQTLNKEVPEGSQETEYLFDKGLFDQVVPRNTLKSSLNEFFQFHSFFSLNQNSIDNINI